MVVQESDIQAIFHEAVSLATTEDRERYLDNVCRGDASVRNRVEALLRAHFEAGAFLAGQRSVPAETESHPQLSEGPGTVIGPYKLLQQIGEGGMGVVFMAEQTEPIARRVAVKIIKPGLDSRQVIARFEGERQALALMDHGNIARVLDAGTTVVGRPFFVMELVKGVPITDYCDQHHLTIRQRLELFIHVCRAVQHAHQKGIIHRDLKPSNVLVAEYDNQAVPKVIDFGVAKATAQKLTERTMFTEFGQVIGTVEYMSPEQAKLNQLDIDTRSDIYSLGVMLYELLTGATPFDRQRLRKAAFDEMLRIIRDEEPPWPSTRLNAADELPDIAANRNLEPLKLNRLLQGELDWIVMKTLEKDRTRRYETASSLADDVQRFLHDETVQARPATRTYRLRKFIRRNKAGVWAGGTVVASLLLGLSLATIGYFQARNQAQIARTQAARATQTQQFLQQMLTSVNPDARRGSAMTVHQMLDRAAGNIDSTFANQPQARIVLHEAIGQAYYGLTLHKQATPHFRTAVDLRQRFMPEDALALADAHLRLGQVYSWDPSKIESALSQCRQALTLYHDHVTNSDPRVVVADSLEAQLAHQTAAGQTSFDIWAARALPIALTFSHDQIAQLPEQWGQAVAKAQELGKAGDMAGAQTAIKQGHMAVLAEVSKLSTNGQADAACQYLRQVYAPCLELPLLREIMPVALISEAWELKRDGANLAVVEVMLREAIAAGQSVWGEEHAYIARALADLAIVLQEQHKFTEAEQPARKALAMRRELLGMEDRDTMASVTFLIELLTRQGKESEAGTLRREFNVPLEGGQQN